MLTGRRGIGPVARIDPWETAMEVSGRLTGVVGDGDDGWGLYVRARAMRDAGEPVVMLNIGDHDISTDPEILAAMRAATEAGHLGYSPVEGTFGLREAIAQRVTELTATPATAGEVVVTAGGQAGLFAAMIAVLDPGQSCVILDPFYATYGQTVRAASGRPIVVATRAEDGFQPDIAAIEAALAPDTRAILINTPNNPSGAVYGRDRLEALAALCRKRGLWLISDEVYANQVWEGAHLSPRDLDGMAEQCLVVNSLSKSHAMTGSRIGWVIGPEAAAFRLGQLSTTTNYGLPGFIQQAAEYAIREGHAAEQAVIDRYRHRREVALAALGNGPGLRVSPPQGGMYLMLDVRETGLSGERFATELLEQEMIAVMPGESFGHAAAGHIRVALTQPEEVLAEAVGRIAKRAARLAG